MEEYAPGDIVEVETTKGLAYVQLTHTHPSYPQAFRTRPKPKNENTANRAVDKVFNS